MYSCQDHTDTCQAYVFLAVGGIHHFGGKRNSAVGTIALAYTASYALVVAVSIIFELKYGAETLGHMHFFAILGIAFCYFGGYKLLACNLHSLDETRYTGTK